MQTKASQIALLLYLVTVLYHPLVIVLHMGSHYAQGWQQEVSHYHHHQQAETDEAADVQFHTHGDEDVNEDRHLPLCVFQCLIPTHQHLEVSNAHQRTDPVSPAPHISVFYPETQGPPPRGLA